MKQKKIYDKCLAKLADKIKIEKHPRVMECKSDGTLKSIKKILTQYQRLRAEVNNRANANKDYSQTELQKKENKRNYNIIDAWYKRWDNSIDEFARDTTLPEAAGTRPSTFLASYAKTAINRGAPLDFVKLVNKRRRGKKRNITLKVRARSAKRRLAERKEQAKQLKILTRQMREMPPPLGPPTERKNWEAATSPSSFY